MNIYACFIALNGNQEGSRKKRGNEKGKKNIKKGKVENRKEDAEFPTWGWPRQTKKRKSEQNRGGTHDHEWP